jgi:hypothetical protein
MIHFQAQFLLYFEFEGDMQIDNAQMMLLVTANKANLLRHESSVRAHTTFVVDNLELISLKGT